MTLALRIIGGILALFGLMGCAAGFLFRIAHWPGASICFAGGGAMVILGILLFTIGFLKRNEKSGH